MSIESDRQKVVRIVQVLTRCSSSDAEKAADRICRDPQAKALLVAACGTSMTLLGVGATASVATAGNPIALGLAGLGGLGVARFCVAAIRGPLNESHKQLLRQK